MARGSSIAASVNVAIGAVFGANFKSVFSDADKRINQLGSTIRRLDREQRTLGDAIQTFGRMGKNVDGLRAKYVQVTDEIRKQRAELEKVAAAEARRRQNLQTRAEVGASLARTTAGAAAAAVPIGMAVSRAAERQYQLRLIGNTADMTAEDVASLGAAMKDAGRQTFQSAEEIEKAMGFLIAAGLDAKVAQQSLVAIGRTATASGADIDDLSRASFVLIDTLGIKPGQALQEALDTLAQAGKEGNVELRDMAKVLPVLGSGFKALKMGGREATATMGAALEIARKGAASADEAANNLQNFLTKVASPTTLERAQEKFGLDLYQIIQDAQASGGNPFEAAVKAIAEATKGDQKLLGELFSDMQVQAFLRPMIQNLSEYERIKQKALTAKGVTDRDFALMAAEAKLQFKGMKDEAGRAADAIGGALAPALGMVAAAITPVLTSITEFTAANPTLVGAVVGTVTALTALRIGILGMRLAWTFVLPVLASVGGTFVTLAKGIGIALTALRALSVFMLTNPLGWAILAITGLATAGYLLWQNWDTVKAGLAAVWEAIKTAAISAFDAIRSSVGAVIDWLAEKTAWIFQTVDKIKGAANSIGDGIGGAFSRARNFVGLGPDGGTSAPTAAAPAATISAVPAAARGVVVQQSNTTNAPISINGASDPQATARALRAELDRRDREAAAERRSGLVDALGY